MRHLSPKQLLRSRKRFAGKGNTLRHVAAIVAASSSCGVCGRPWRGAIYCRGGRLRRVMARRENRDRRTKGRLKTAEVLSSHFRGEFLALVK